MTARIAIIGAGLAGLTLAHRLKGHGEVSLFEKGAGVGGRLSTFRSAGFQFDHGAQYFTIRSEGFREFLEPALQKGIVAPWKPKIATLEEGKAPVDASRDETIYVGVPGMDALCRYLSDGLFVVTEVEVTSCSREDAVWKLVSAAGDELGYVK